MLTIDEIVAELSQPPARRQWHELDADNTPASIQKEILKTILPRRLRFRCGDETAECIANSGRIMRLNGRTVSEFKDLQPLIELGESTAAVCVASELIEANDIEGDGFLWIEELPAQTSVSHNSPAHHQAAAELTIANHREIASVGTEQHLETLRSIYARGLASHSGEAQFAVFSNGHQEEHALVVYEAGPQLTLSLWAPAGVSAAHQRWANMVGNAK